MGFFKSTVHVLTLLCAEGIGFSQVPSQPPLTPNQVQSTPIDVESAKHGILKIADDKSTIVELYDPTRKILIVGNRHDVVDMLEEMTRSLSGLHDKGIKNLDLECDKEAQAEIDQYTSGKLSENEVIGYFGKAFQWVNPEKYFEMIDEARRLKMHISCDDTYDKPMDSGDAARLRKVIEDTVDPLMEKYRAAKAANDAVVMEEIDKKVFAITEPIVGPYRNSAMASKLDKNARENGPVVMFVGGAHLGDNRLSDPGTEPAMRENTIETELNKLRSSNEVMSILLRGGQSGLVFTNEEQNGICRSFGVGEECWAQKNNRANDRYVREGRGEATFILHLPEKLSAQSQGRAPRR